MSTPSNKIRVRRAYKRGAYDRETIDAILDCGLMAHIGYIFDDEPIVTPMLYWREEDYVYWHGSTASRAMKAAIDAPVCVTVTHMDGLVLARSAFHHSANYRSVMLFGTSEIVAEREHKIVSLKAFMDQQFPERWDMLRPVSEKELKATMILRLKIDEAAAKVRIGPPKDDEDDLALPLWTGVLPLQQEFQTPIDAPDSGEATAPPKHVFAKVGTKI